MPRKSKRPCSHPGCPNLTEDKYCEEHKSLHPDRPSAAKRGYGSKWQRVSKAYLPGILCVCGAKHRDGSRQRPWSTILFLTVVIRI